MTRRSILLAEDDALLRRILPQLLETQGFDVVGSVGTAREVAAAVSELQPCVLLLDLHLPDLSGLEVLDRLRADENSPPVLVLSGDDTREAQLGSAQKGARGFLHKGMADLATLAEAVRAVADGGYWFPQELVKMVINDYATMVRRAQQEESRNPLSTAEVRILSRAARGMTNAQIAADLFMSVSNVKLRFQSILRKLNVPNRTEAAVVAVRDGLIESGGGDDGDQIA